MIADDNQPILMDFGSTVKARIKVENRSQALLQQVGNCRVMESSLLLTTARSTRILPLNRAPWHIARPSCSMSRLVSRSTKRSTFGYVIALSLITYSHRIPTTQSLGCTLYALAYSHSPFENTQTTEQGGSIAMAVMGAQYKHPSSAYSQGLKNLIDSMLKVNPQERPDIHEVRALLLFITGVITHVLRQVIRLTEEVMRSLR